jgi:pilus assembly protein Flp/PilA
MHENRVRSFVHGSPQTKEKDMLAAIVRFVKADEGVTAIEYGLIAALIGIAMIAAVTLVGTNLTAKFNAVATALQ